MELRPFFDVWGSHCCSSQMIFIRPVPILAKGQPSAWLHVTCPDLFPFSEAHRHTASCSYANLLIRLWKFFLVTLLHFKQRENRNTKHIIMSLILSSLTSQQHNNMSSSFITFRYLSMPARESGVQDEQTAGTEDQCFHWGNRWKCIEKRIDKGTM